MIFFWTRLLLDWESVLASRVETIQLNSKFFFLHSHKDSLEEHVLSILGPRIESLLC